MKIILALMGALVLVGCAVPLERPQNFVEQVAYAEASAQAAARTVDALTCLKGYDAKGACLEPGKPLTPAQGLEMQETILKARQGLRAAVSLPEGGGECLGATRTAQDCLQAAMAILNSVETYLQGRK